MIETAKYLEIVGVINGGLVESVVTNTFPTPCKLTVINVDEDLLTEPPAAIDSQFEYTEYVESTQGFIQGVLAKYNENWKGGEDE